MNRPRSSFGKAACLLPLLVALAAMVALPRNASAQGMADDPFGTALVGEWEGEGVYEGNTLSLTRSWSLELWDQFLRGDMQVTMANGASFGALTFWKPVGDGAYEALWMDGTGRMQNLQALRDPTSGLISTNFLDEFTQGPPEQRRWEFEVTGENTYVERLYAQDDGGWELLTEFRFRRVGSH